MSEPPIDSDNAARVAKRAEALAELARMGERGDFVILLQKDNYRRCRWNLVGG
ncbi:hypothetical protein [Nocardia yamanashiensis]|uniref:hypothetical protein n=1 Tax=Nocardia yamanashiensis TaxID=209247 RepID=UPI000AF90225|nr:hypothetical protein [Nocardia yamanashiensis]